MRESQTANPTVLRLDSLASGLDEGPTGGDFSKKYVFFRKLSAPQSRRFGMPEKDNPMNVSLFRDGKFFRIRNNQRKSRLPQSRRHERPRSSSSQHSNSGGASCRSSGSGKFAVPEKYRIGCSGMPANAPEWRRAHTEDFWRVTQIQYFEAECKTRPAHRGAEKLSERSEATQW